MFKSTLLHASIGHPVSLDWPLGAVVAQATGVMPRALDMTLPDSHPLKSGPQPHWDTHAKLRNCGRSEMSVAPVSGTLRPLQQAWEHAMLLSLVCTMLLLILLLACALMVIMSYALHMLVANL
jgi:hypothetical protein